MTLLIALGTGDPNPWVTKFREFLPGMQIAKLGDDFDPDEIQYAMSWYHPVGSLSNLPNLRAIFSMGAGVDHLFRDPNLPDVPMARIVDSDLTNRMTEYVVMHTLNILRQSRRYRTQQLQGVWQDDDLQPVASDIRVGIMGMGVLGSDAARKLALLGFKVAGWSTSEKQIDGVKSYCGSSNLPPFLARTDILISLLPLTPETRGIINSKILKGLARDGRVPAPSLINAGRGGLQIEDDILACLDDGIIHEAVLDVFQTEPLPPTSRLWSHPNVTVTPHNASVSNPLAIGRSIAEKIKTLESGGKLLNSVHRDRGY